MRIPFFLHRKTPVQQDLDRLKGEIGLLTEKVTALRKEIERIDEHNGLTRSAQVELRRDLDEMRSTHSAYAHILNDPEVVTLTSSIGRDAA